MEVFSHTNKNGEKVEAIVNRKETLDGLVALQNVIDKREVEIDDIKDDIHWLEITNIDHDNDSRLAELYNKVTGLSKGLSALFKQSTELFEHDRGAIAA